MTWRYGSGTVGLLWMLVLAATLLTAAETGSLIVWSAGALVALLPALTLMVLAQSPAKTVAEIILDAENRP